MTLKTEQDPSGHGARRSPELLQAAADYQVSQEVPLLGAHIVEPHPPIHEAADRVAGGQGEGAVLGQGWRWYCFTGGAGVLTFTG